MIIPLTNSASSRKLFDSWDCFQVPLPFSRIVVEYGEPVGLEGREDKAQREKVKRALQRNLNELTASLDRNLGYSGSKVWPHEDN
jgi:hypothetical protein